MFLTFGDDLVGRFQDNSRPECFNIDSQDIEDEIKILNIMDIDVNTPMPDDLRNAVPGFFEGEQTVPLLILTQLTVWKYR